MSHAKQHLLQFLFSCLSEKGVKTSHMSYISENIQVDNSWDVTSYLLPCNGLLLKSDLIRKAEPITLGVLQKTDQSINVTDVHVKD